MANIHDVAAYVTSHFRADISTMKLQKLCYISQGWSLALLDEEMFAERFEAWANGPVSYALFDKHRGDYSVGSWPAGDVSRLSERQVVVLNGVLANYGALTGLQLSELTHRDGTPWSVARGDAPRGARSNAEISPEQIKTHFRNLLGVQSVDSAY